VIVGYYPLKIGENKGTIGRVFKPFPFIGHELVFTEKRCFGWVWLNSLKIRFSLKNIAGKT